MTHTERIHAKRLMFVLALLILPVMIIGCACAAPPVLSSVQTNTLDIASPIYEVIPQNTAFEFYWHVSNATTLLTNATTICSFHLYSVPANGTHIYSAYATYDNSDQKRDFEVSLNSANFTKVGRYSRIIECNTSGQTGYLASFFEVTPSGLDIQDESLPVMIGLGILMICLVALSFIWKPEQAFIKALFIILALLIGLIISQLAYALSILRTFYNMISTLNILFIALIAIIVLLLSIALLRNVFEKAKTMKRNKKERNENEIV